MRIVLLRKYLKDIMKRIAKTTRMTTLHVWGIMKPGENKTRIVESKNRVVHCHHTKCGFVREKQLDYADDSHHDIAVLRITFLQR